MARAIWNGTISFGLVTIPVGLHPAIESRERLSFDLLHAKDHSRIQYRRFCQGEGVEVPADEIVKGYAYQKGQYVVVTDEDFEKARVPATQTAAPPPGRGNVRKLLGWDDTGPRERGEGSASPSAAAAGL